LDVAINFLMWSYFLDWGNIFGEWGHTFFDVVIKKNSRAFTDFGDFDVVIFFFDVVRKIFQAL